MTGIDGPPSPMRRSYLCKGSSTPAGAAGSGADSVQATAQPQPPSTMGKPFLSRHFLGEDPCSIAAIPFAAAGAAEAGVALTHNLLALGTWSEDAQVRARPMTAPVRSQPL